MTSPPDTKEANSKSSSPYFFTALDPDFRIKGARDPLGFQAIWSEAGRELIAHLSTVSTSLRDFMILSYGSYFYGGVEREGFVPFFLKFEQACAFARMHFLKDGTFNGTRFVSKHMDARAKKDAFSCSLKRQDTLLSNQKAYGIHGKYVRPFHDMGIEQDEHFQNVMEGALDKTDLSRLRGIIERLKAKEWTLLSEEELRTISKLIEKPHPGEQAFFRRKILSEPELDSEDATCAQADLYRVLSENPDIVKNEEGRFDLYSFLSAVKKASQATERLKKSCDKIERSERLLYPLDRAFTHLLSRSYWSLDDLDKDPVFSKLRTQTDQPPEDSSLLELWEIRRAETNREMVHGLVERNEKVARARGSGAWVEKDGDRGFRVLYGDQGEELAEKDVDPWNGNINPYFIPTYLNLFRQIENPAS